jgi:hypothetical protein
MMYNGTGPVNKKGPPLYGKPCDNIEQGLRLYSENIL